MSLPDDMRDRLRDRLWGIADRIDWLSLGPTEKSQHYENWTKDPQVGGILGRYMDARRVRVYIKDSLLKDYSQARQSDARVPLKLLGITADATISKVFIKPHGRRLADGKVVCWGRANDWKAILMALHERAFEHSKYRPYGAVLSQASVKFGLDEARAVVADAAKKLGIQKLIWLD